MKRVFVLLPILLVFFLSGSVLAQELTEQIEDINSRIQEYEQKIAQLRNEEETLQNEIEYLDSQIYLTWLRIKEAQNNIADKERELSGLSEDIGALGVRINKLGESLDYQKELFAQRARAEYKNHHRGSWEGLLVINSLSDYVSRSKYLRVMEQRDQELIATMAQLRDDFRKQKEMLSLKKIEVESLKAAIESEKNRLITYQSQIDQQRKDKAYILEQTQNDESRYQDLLAQARAEQAAIEAAVASFQFTDGKEVEAGEAIAVMGNSGYPNCSTGAHLHFEVRVNGAYQDPAGYLKAYTDPNGESLGSGGWDWPMNTPIITQRYGNTPYSWRYSNNIHTGIDMYNNDDPFIHTPLPGTLYSGQTTCGSSSLNYVVVDHGGGVMTWYFHVK